MGKGKPKENKPTKTPAKTPAVDPRLTQAKQDMATYRSQITSAQYEITSMQSRQSTLINLKDRLSTEYDEIDSQKSGLDTTYMPSEDWRGDNYNAYQYYIDGMRTEYGNECSNISNKIDNVNNEIIKLETSISLNQADISTYQIKLELAIELYNKLK